MGMSTHRLSFTLRGNLSVFRFPAAVGLMLTHLQSVWSSCLIDCCCVNAPFLQLRIYWNACLPASLSPSGSAGRSRHKTPLWPNSPRSYFTCEVVDEKGNSDEFETGRSDKSSRLQITCCWNSSQKASARESDYLTKDDLMELQAQRDADEEYCDGPGCLFYCDVTQWGSCFPPRWLWLIIFLCGTMVVKMPFQQLLRDIGTSHP